MYTAYERRRHAADLSMRRAGPAVGLRSRPAGYCHS